LSQEQLSHTMLPLGEFTKAQVRQMARDFGLPVSERPDSQDLCFLGVEDYRDFLRRFVPQVVHPGPIMDRDGKPLGVHRGLAFYTIGQRKGLGIDTLSPHYVLAKDTARNALIVGVRDELGCDSLVAGSIHWISGQTPQNPFRAQVKIRYKAQESWGLVIPMEGSCLRVKFDHPLRDITPGQAVVIYQDDACLGGGIILAEDLP
jgi:tRNA-uridine 2-sulfurtransferase